MHLGPGSGRQTAVFIKEGGRKRNENMKQSRDQSLSSEKNMSGWINILHRYLEKKKKIGHNIQETASITGFVFFNFEGSRMAIFRH